MLDHLDEDNLAQGPEEAVATVIAAGEVPGYDMGRKDTTTGMAVGVAARLQVWSDLMNETAHGSARTHGWLLSSKPCARHSVGRPYGHVTGPLEPVAIPPSTAHLTLRHSHMFRCMPYHLRALSAFWPTRSVATVPPLPGSWVRSRPSAGRGPARPTPTLGAARLLFVYWDL